MIRLKDKELSDFLALSKRIESFPKKLYHRDEWIPICDVAYIRGNYVDTNKFNVMIGQEYFVEKSATETVQFINRRIRDGRESREGFEKQKELAVSRLEFAEHLFNQQNDMVEIKEEYTKDKMKKPSIKFETGKNQENTEVKEDIMDMLDRLEKEERDKKELDEIDDVSESERYATMAADKVNNEEEISDRPKKPKGVPQEEFDRLLKQVEEMDKSSDDDEEYEDESMEDEESDAETEVEDKKPNRRPTFKVEKIIDKKKDLDSDDSEEDTSMVIPDKPIKKRSVHFADVLESGHSITPPVISEPKPILRNKDEKPNIDIEAIKAMNEDEFRKKEILPQTDVCFYYDFKSLFIPQFLLGIQRYFC